MTRQAGQVVFRSVESTGSPWDLEVGGSLGFGAWSLGFDMYSPKSSRRPIPTDRRPFDRRRQPRIRPVTRKKEARNRCPGTGPRRLAWGEREGGLFLSHDGGPYRPEPSGSRQRGLDFTSSEIGERV